MESSPLGQEFNKATFSVGSEAWTNYSATGKIIAVYKLLYPANGGTAVSCTTGEFIWIIGVGYFVGFYSREYYFGEFTVDSAATSIAPNYMHKATISEDGKTISIYDYYNGTYQVIYST